MKHHKTPASPLVFCFAETSKTRYSPLATQGVRHDYHTKLERETQPNRSASRKTVPEDPRRSGRRNHRRGRARNGLGRLGRPGSSHSADGDLRYLRVARGHLGPRAHHRHRHHRRTSCGRGLWPHPHVREEPGSTLRVGAHPLGTRQPATDPHVRERRSAPERVQGRHRLHRRAHQERTVSPQGRTVLRLRFGTRPQPRTPPLRGVHCSGEAHRVMCLQRGTRVREPRRPNVHRPTRRGERGHEPGSAGYALGVLHPHRRPEAEGRRLRGGGVVHQQRPHRPARAWNQHRNHAEQGQGARARPRGHGEDRRDDQLRPTTHSGGPTRPSLRFSTDPLAPPPHSVYILHISRKAFFDTIFPYAAHSQQPSNQVLP